MGIYKNKLEELRKLDEQKEYINKLGDKLTEVNEEGSISDTWQWTRGGILTAVEEVSGTKVI